MSTATARIKLQVWEWIPDRRAAACRVYVYDPVTVMPVYWGWTNVDGYLEFDIEAGMYVIWVWGHNPVGYRPFLSDTWIRIAVLPGETKEVCAPLVSLIDIPVLYQAALSGTHWEPETFAELLGQYVTDVQAGCTATAKDQRGALFEEFSDLRKGVVRPIEAPIDVREHLLERRHEWAEAVVEVDPEVKEEVQKIVEAMEAKRTEAPLGPCSEIAGIKLDLSALPFPPGPLPPSFTFEGVEFTRIWHRIELGNALWCYAGEEFPPGTWNDATVRLDFRKLPCLVCEIVGDVNPHGPEARLTGTLWDGTSQTAVSPGSTAVTLQLAASPENPFIFAELSGREAEWFSVFLG